LEQIPVYEPRSRTGARDRLYCFADAEYIERNAKNLEVIRTRRAKAPVRAYLRSLSAHCVRLLPSRHGQCISQVLPESGHVVYALGGIRGSA
jgi:hypothetical protein